MSTRAMLVYVGLLAVSGGTIAQPAGPGPKLTPRHSLSRNSLRHLL